MKKTREEQEVRDLDELFERYRQAPDSFVFVPLADACRKMGRIDEALDICEGGVRRHPAYPSGHVVRGKCLFDKGDREGARDTFDRVLRLDENNLVALKYLGMIEADAGDLSAAQKHFRHILSLDPDNKEIRTILHIVDQQDEPAAVPEPSGADVMEGVDEILRGHADDFDPMAEDEPVCDPVMEAVSSADELETSDELASVTLAEIFASQGYKSKAEKIYREVLRRQPASVEVRKRLRDLFPEGGDPDSPEESGGTGSSSPGVPQPEVVDFSSGQAREPAAGGGGAAEGAPGSADAPETEAEPSPEKPDVETEARTGAGRAEIDEKDSLGHFKRWLTRMQP